VRHLVYAEKRPERMLLDHEIETFELLRKRFPESRTGLLTERSFLRLKSLVALNGFAIHAESLTVHLKKKSADNVPAQPAEDDGGMPYDLSLAATEPSARGSALYGLVRLLRSYRLAIAFSRSLHPSATTYLLISSFSFATSSRC